MPDGLTLSASLEDGLSFDKNAIDSFDRNAVDGSVRLRSDDRVSLADGRWLTIGVLASTYSVYVWDPAASTRARLRDIAAYPWDPQWVVAAEYRQQDSELVRAVARARSVSPLGEDVSPIPGAFAFTLHGERHRLLAFEPVPGILLVVFRDGTSGTETPSIGRWLILPTPETGPVRLDFNRAMLPHHVFAESFPCPLPPQENHLPLRVEAGERVPLRD
ncbi:hypothetical protein B1H18_15215 [Streptomyces tsukubensis]|uniref:DUF1684 domain-containing protein n=1 Tax=Streptomyces tsukubensis TaxID=83656 RepID=A0A1V4A852_9ACTN|nr:hypothetical protein B1H18_15215 [Streptomyces tsukubensis]